MSNGTGLTPPPSPVGTILQAISDARAAHSAAETSIFTSYVNGQPLSAAVPAVNSLITANTNLANALNQLLAALH